MASKIIPFPEMPVMEGIRLSSCYCGIKKKQQNDLVLIELPTKAVSAGIFTTNAFRAPPVLLCEEHLKKTPNTRYLLINSGNANAATGKMGKNSAESCCSTLSQLSQVQPQNILPFSTGVIGEPLPVECIQQALPTLLETLSKTSWLDAAKGLMTTDTFAKGATLSQPIGDEMLVVNGIAKGSGMIHPNMATMLAFVFVNVSIEPSLLKETLHLINEKTFNRISVDGDTSTNDSFVVVATGNPRIQIDKTQSREYQLFEQSLQNIAQQLALAIIRDGEGASKLLTIKVEAGKNSRECKNIAFAIAHSPLVKTALFASDPNWGRIIAAIGNAGVTDLDTGRVNVFLDEVQIVDGGQRAQDYSEAQGEAIMNQTDITLRIELGRGKTSETVLTSDLSYDYVRINSDYRS